MGSISPYTNQERQRYAEGYSQGYHYKQQQPAVEVGQPQPDRTLVLLINSVYYFLECVYILYKNDSYQLVVLHNNRLLTQKNYKTLKGAKIAFQKMYYKKAWQRGVKADWTHPYKADSDWLAKKDKAILKQPLKAYSI